MHQNKNQYHQPVLLDEVLSVLDPKKGESYLDLTAGYGGHASHVLELTGAPEATTLVDRDGFAIEKLKERFEGQVEVIHEDFLQAAEQLRANGKKFDLVLADLGVSSPHLNTASRGFSIRSDGPLDMRMDSRQALTAAEIVNEYSKEELVRILREYGEEPRAGRIADAIIANRPINSTHELAHVIAKQWRGRSKVHPATRTFQAIRIEVNDELSLLKRALPVMVDLLTPGGRLAIISFHSLEDRIAKQFFKQVAGNRFDTELRTITKRPLMANDNEIVSNPRSRSAKLRGVVKIKKKG